MTNPIAVTNLLPLDSARASSQQELLASQDVGDASSEQQLEGEFGALLAQMVLGAAVQAPLTVTGGIGVLPETNDAALDASENPIGPVSNKSLPMPFAVQVPSLLQAKNTPGNESTETAATVAKASPLSSTVAVAEEQGEQSGKEKVTDGRSAPATNVRENTEFIQGKTAVVSSTEIVAGEQGERFGDATITHTANVPTNNVRKSAESTEGKIVPAPEPPAGKQVERTDDATITNAARLPATNAHESAGATKGKIASAPAPAIAAGKQGEQPNAVKITDATNLPVNNLRNDGEVNKGKTIHQVFSPILQIDHEAAVQHVPEKEPIGVIKNLPLDSKEKITLQQNSVAVAAQFTQSRSQKVGAGRTIESKVTEPVVVPNPDTAIILEGKKDFLKPAQAIVQPQIQSDSKTIKENHNESETETQAKDGQNTSISAAKAAESSQSHDAVVKPVTTSQSGRGSHQPFTQMPSEHLTAKVAEQVSTEQLSPLTPELSKSVIDQITKELTFRMKDNVSEIRVLLKPESLGEVVVSMQMEESKITAQINVDQSNVKAAVEAQLPQLRQTLAERGIDIHRIEVFVADQSLARESRDQQSGKSKKRGGNIIGSEEHDLNYSPRSLGYNTIELLI